MASLAPDEAGDASRGGSDGAYHSDERRELGGESGVFGHFWEDVSAVSICGLGVDDRRRGEGCMRVEEPAMYGCLRYLHPGPWSLVTVTRPNQDC